MLEMGRMWNEAATKYGFPKVHYMTADGNRARKIHELGLSRKWEGLLGMIASSAYLHRSSWFGMDWVLRKDHAERIMAGKYLDAETADPNRILTHDEMSDIVASSPSLTTDDFELVAKHIEGGDWRRKS